MQILLVRHAPAEDRAAFARSGRTDDERPLTEQGRKKMVANARGLRRLVPRLDALATSPYVRAAQTADILAREYPRLVPQTLECLTPDGSRDALAKWLRRHGGPRTVSLVGHEPWLGETIAWLLTSTPTPVCELRKGGACLLELRSAAGPGRAALQWIVPPRVLRELARR
jgi:phosphohistidine phosphatase